LTRKQLCSHPGILYLNLNYKPSMLENYSEEYWNHQYLQKATGWDIGYVATPFKNYFDQLKVKNIRILVPGAGSAYEVEYLFQQGFHQTYLLDISSAGIEKFRKRCPKFPTGNIFNEDFFQHNGTNDLIVEQTFLSSFPPARREEYVDKMYNLLKPRGKLVALLFNHHFLFEGPPFGGSEKEYKEMFNDKFDIIHFDQSYNSIKPRRGREFFILLRKKS